MMEEWRWWRNEDDGGMKVSVVDFFNERFVCMLFKSQSTMNNECNEREE